MSQWTGSTDPTTTETTTSYIPDSTTQYSWIFSFGAGDAKVKSKKVATKPLFLIQKMVPISSLFRIELIALLVQ